MRFCWTLRRSIKQENANLKSMPDEQARLYDHVGPVLQSGVLGSAIESVIRDLNRDVLVLDRGAYFRVLVHQRCVVITFPPTSSESRIWKHWLPEA